NQIGKWKMDARFSRKELIRRVEAIASQHDKIFLHNWDAEKFILEHISGLPNKTLVYCDPPYYKKASRLYLNSYSEEDHSRIAKIIQTRIKHKWMVSYDKSVEILREYPNRKSFIYSLRYNASRRYEGQEICIFSDDICLPSYSKLACIGERVKRARPARELLDEMIS
ncbi:MAG: DNA adenine methylase, partial [Cyanobacteria bacterium P01_H01_bin.119]